MLTIQDLFCCPTVQYQTIFGVLGEKKTNKQNRIQCNFHLQKCSFYVLLPLLVICRHTTFSRYLSNWSLKWYKLFYEHVWMLNLISAVRNSALPLSISRTKDSTRSWGVPGCLGWSYADCACTVVESVEGSAGRKQNPQHYGVPRKHFIHTSIDLQLLHGLRQDSLVSPGFYCGANNIALFYKEVIRMTESLCTLVPTLL